MSRNLERATARALYAKFAQKWRQEKRDAGVYGQAGYRRPSFNEWYSMQKNNKKESQAYVQEQLSLEDPWAQELKGSPQPDKTEERGVMTFNVAGSEDD